MPHHEYQFIHMSYIKSAMAKLLCSLRCQVKNWGG